MAAGNAKIVHYLLEKYKDKITQEQARLLLNKIHDLYRKYSFEKDMSEEEKEK